MKLNHYLLYALFLGAFSCTDIKINSNENSTPTIVDKINYTANKSQFKDKSIVLVSGDEEYRSEEVLPQLAKILSLKHGFNCTVLFAQDPENPGIVRPDILTNIPGLESLEKADLMVIFTRFRALPDQQMQYLHNFLLEGKPVLGIRTATHAFDFKDSTSQWYKWGNSFTDEKNPWDGGFGRVVLGEKWIAHHGHHKHQSSRGIVAPTGKGHPITNGIPDGLIWGPTDVYRVRLPLPDNATPIILGQVINRSGAFDENDPFFGMKSTDNEIAIDNPVDSDDKNPNDPLMPIAWIKDYQIPEGDQGTAFTTTIGSSTDFANEGVRRLMVNAVHHLLNLEVPVEADVSFVGQYEPTAYKFHKEDYWVKKNLKVEDFQIPQK